MIIIHPGPGLDSGIFFPWFERLARSYRVIAIDLPGHGRSQTGSPASWSIKNFAARVTEFVVDLGLEGYVILGHSFGSFVALQHVVDFPGHPRGVVVSCGVAHVDALAEQAPLGLSALAPEARELVERAWEVEVRTEADALAMWQGQMNLLVREIGGTAHRLLDDALRQVVFQPDIIRHDDFGEYDVREQLADVLIPSLVVTGRDDHMVTPTMAQEVAGRLPHSSFAVIERAGHFPFAEQPGAYFDALTGWLESMHDTR